MAFAIGYNVKQANELMDNIAEAYKNLGIYTNEQWKGVVDALQANWVGEDEQDFEQKLAQRICNLYINASKLAEGCVNTIAGLSQAWYDFQSRNILDGESAIGKSKININIPKIKKEDQIVKARIKTISNDEDRGLRDASSKVNIQEAVNTFVGQIKQRTDGLFQEIDANTAFFGDQTANIKSYVERVGSAIAEVTIAVKDMNEALEKLANSNYTTSSADIKEELTKASSNVETSLNDLGNSRWS